MDRWTDGWTKRCQTIVVIPFKFATVTLCGKDHGHNGASHLVVPSLGIPQYSVPQCNLECSAGYSEKQVQDLFGNCELVRHN